MSAGGKGGEGDDEEGKLGEEGEWDEFGEDSEGVECWSRGGSVAGELGACDVAVSKPLLVVEGEHPLPVALPLPSSTLPLKLSSLSSFASSSPAPSSTGSGVLPHSWVPAASLAEELICWR